MVNMAHNNRVWTNANGQRKRFNKIGHQHLSNILWYLEVFWGETPLNSHTYRQLYSEIINRYNGKMLPWKPLPITGEIDTLYKRGAIDDNGNIIFNSKKIGSIKHIKNNELY